MALSRITPASLNWPDEQTPISTEFDDVYFSRAGGPAETQYVFIDGNHLTERWAQLKPGQSFVIAETGFGTGLNFLVTWQCWQQMKDQGAIAKDCTLHFLSVDLHPLTLQDLHKALSGWDDLQPLSNHLQQQYPWLNPGSHRLDFGDVQLTLMFGDASQCYQQASTLVDAWFLDGFAPAKNPEMWQSELFQAIARLSGLGTTAATFTAARLVRDGLTGIGFEVQKRAGFGRKREMLLANYQGIGPQQPADKHPWFATPATIHHPELPIAVIGAGIAGSQCVLALAKRGVTVDLFDRHPTPAQGASGNQQGALYVKLAPELSHHSRFYALAYDYAVRQCQSLEQLEWQSCGVLQTAFNDKERKRQQRFVDQRPFDPLMAEAVDADQASELAGIELADSALWFSKGGWVHPGSLCQIATQQARFIGGRDIHQLQMDKQRWTLVDQHGKYYGPYRAVILATADSFHKLPQLASLPLNAIRGQVTSIQVDHPPPLKTVLCSHAYVSPPRQQQLNLGATFNLQDDDPEVRDSDHQTNLENIANNFPSLQPWLSGEQKQGRVGFRCTSPDYLPVVGPVPDWQNFQQQYQDIRRFRHKVWPNASFLPGLYCSLAHGSRGLASTPLAGELLASMILGEPLPLERELTDHLHPARFLVKQLYKG